jgi:hypothetical protein
VVIDEVLKMCGRRLHRRRVAVSKKHKQQFLEVVEV